MKRVKPFLYTVAWFVFGVFALYFGIENWRHKSVQIKSKHGDLYIASPEAHQISYYIHTVGFIFFGVVLLLLALHMFFFVLFSRSPKSESIIDELNSPKNRTQIPGWLATLVIASFIGFCIYAAIRT